MPRVSRTGGPVSTGAALFPFGPTRPADVRRMADTTKRTWMTLTEAAAACGVSDRTMHRWVASGRVERQEASGRVLIGVPDELHATGQEQSKALAMLREQADAASATVAIVQRQAAEQAASLTAVIERMDRRASRATWAAAGMAAALAVTVSLAGVGLWQATQAAREARQASDAARAAGERLEAARAALERERAEMGEVTLAAERRALSAETSLEAVLATIQPGAVRGDAHSGMSDTDCDGN